MLVEIQALVSTSSYGNARRMASGLDQNRLSLLLAVLEKRAGLNLIAEDVFVNVAGGMAVDEPAADLGIVAAVASSVRNRPIKPAHGGVRRGRPGRGSARHRARRRCACAKRRRWGSPAASCPTATAPRTMLPAGCELVGVKTVGEALDQSDGLVTRGGAAAPPCGTSRRRRSAELQLRGPLPDTPRLSDPDNRYHRDSFIFRSSFMAWFLLARALFVLAVTYAAVLTGRSARSHCGPIALSARCLGLSIVCVETRLRDAEVTDLLGALIGGAIGLGLAKTIGAALFWADTTDPRVVFLHSFILLVFPYLGIVMGARKGEWLEPARLVGLFRDTGPQKRYRILDTSVIIDGRIADVCETGFLDGTLVIPQFVLKELQLVADSADSLKRNRGRRGLDILQKIQKMSGVDVMISDIDFPEVREVDLKLIELGAHAAGEDRHQRLQPEQGRAAARRRGAQHQRARQRAQAGRPAGRVHEGLHPQGRQGIQPGRRLPRRRDDGGRRQRAADDQQEHRHRRHQRAADDGGQDDLRPLHRRAVARTAAGAAGAGGGCQRRRLSRPPRCLRLEAPSRNAK